MKANLSFNYLGFDWSKLIFLGVYNKNDFPDKLMRTKSDKANSINSLITTIIVLHQMITACRLLLCKNLLHCAGKKLIK